MLMLVSALSTHGQDLLEPLASAAVPESDTAEMAAMMEPLTVTATALGAPDTLGAASMQSVSFVPAATLRRNAQASLGETLGWEAGVSSNYCGPGASRPVVRGFEGVRVRMLRDGLGTFDLSDLSPDHGVTLEPLLLESVEIHRGPASLLYGNSAIGGAINSHSRVLSRERPTRPLSGAIEMQAESQGDGIGGAGYVAVADGAFVLQLTGAARDANDISIPGFARTAAYEATENPLVYDPATSTESPVPNPHGSLPNSFHRSDGGSIGLSWLPTDLPLMLGAAISTYSSEYGVPYFYPGDSTDLFGLTSIDISQMRVDLEGRAELATGPLSRIEMRLGYGEYRHDEFFHGLAKDAGRDFTDTALSKDTGEARVDFHHRDFIEGLTGIWGVTVGGDRFIAHRALLPPPGLIYVESVLESRQAGLYLLEKYQRGEWTLQAGGRWEMSDITDRSLEDYDFTQGVKDGGGSLSTALTWQRESLPQLDRLSVTGIASQVTRLPTATERYAFWNSAGIGRFLVGGDMDGTPLSAEESLGFEIGVEAVRDPFTLRANLYHYRFDNFIFLQEVPALTGGFGKAAQFIERVASFTGFETQFDWKIREHLTLTLMSDYVHATNLTDDEPIPRMPPLRLGGRLEWADDRFTAGVEIRHATEQDRVKPAPRPELPTDAFTLVNADVSWRARIRSQDLTLSLRLSNLLDQDARSATSFRKDVAPQPGRSLMLGLRYEF